VGAPRSTDSHLSRRARCTQHMSHQSETGLVRFSSIQYKVCSQLIEFYNDCIACPPREQSQLSREHGLSYYNTVIALMLCSDGLFSFLSLSHILRAFHTQIDSIHLANFDLYIVNPQPCYPLCPICVNPTYRTYPAVPVQFNASRINKMRCRIPNITSFIACI
jgi:hypothetical protein